MTGSTINFEIEKESEVELRMYSFSLYQFANTIHAGIQSYHATVEYGLKYGFYDETFFDWAKNWKTTIILNGGTTSKLEQIIYDFDDNDFKYCEFREPDLGHIVTAISFIVDERVFNKIKYPDYENSIFSKVIGDEKIKYFNWVQDIGGEKNLWLREYLKPFKLL